MRGATHSDCYKKYGFKFLLTRPLRGATLRHRNGFPICYFYSHAPCGARHIKTQDSTTVYDFYSHAPCGARQNWPQLDDRQEHFYSHAPCGARPAPVPVRRRACTFLLTRPLRGATLTVDNLRYPLHNFYSHAPCGARLHFRASTFSIPISTHTPLAGRDSSNQRHINNRHDFYSHAPCGARRCYSFLVGV